MLGRWASHADACVLGAGLLALGCNPEGRSCEEDERVLDLGPRQTILVGGEPLEVEIADPMSEPWAHRRCELEGLAIVPMQAEVLEVPTCQLLGAVDVAFVQEGRIVDVIESVDPCSETDCDRCLAISSADAEPVQAALQTLAGDFGFGLGQTVSGLPGPGTD